LILQLGEWVHFPKYTLKKSIAKYTFSKSIAKYTFGKSIAKYTFGKSIAKTGKPRKPPFWKKI
jgi:hypothetical protein